MTHVVIAETVDRPSDDLSLESSILGPSVDLKFIVYGEDEERFIAGCRGADAVIADLAPLTREVIGELTNCRLVSIAATGFNNVDLDAAADANMSICAISDYCSEEVADHAMMLMLALVRRVMPVHAQIQRDGVWDYNALTGVKGMRDLTLGIIGFGKIGRAVARRASGFGMSVIVHDQFAADGNADAPPVRFCDMPTLLGAADVISLNCALTDTNHNLLDSGEFRQMARKPILINCARGELVNEAALIEALDEGLVSGAGLDVLRDEPPDLEKMALTGRDNVIITPHVAWFSDGALLRCRSHAAQNVRHFLDGNHELVDRYVVRAFDGVREQ